MNTIETLREEALALLNEDDKPFISIEKAAKLLGMDKECLRISIANGTCRFGVGGTHRDTGTQFGKVSKLALWSFLGGGPK